MTKKKPAKQRPKLTDEDRHKRFIEMAEEVGASTKAEDFERALSRVTQPAKDAER